MLILYFGVYDNNSNIDNEELMIFIIMTILSMSTIVLSFYFELL